MGGKKELFTSILALRKGLKALFEAVCGSSSKVLEEGTCCRVLRAPLSHCKPHIKMSSRRVLEGETKVKIRAQMPTKIPHLGLVVKCKMCSPMLLIKCCLWGKRSRSGQMSLKEERQMCEEISCNMFIFVLARRCWTICTRAEVKSSGCLVLQGLQPAEETFS